MAGRRIVVAMLRLLTLLLDTGIVDHIRRGIPVSSGYPEQMCISTTGHTRHSK
jgi:hypothetical protein